MTRITDTHSLVWYLNKDKCLSDAARSALADPEANIIVPCIALAEVAFLHSRGRITISLARVLEFLHSAANCDIHPLDEAILTLMPSGLEMHDAIIVATALLHHERTGDAVALITRDEEITASGLVDVLW